MLGSSNLLSSLKINWLKIKWPLEVLIKKPHRFPSQPGLLSRNRSISWKACRMEKWHRLWFTSQRLNPQNNSICQKLIKRGTQASTLKRATTDKTSGRGNLSSLLFMRRILEMAKRRLNTWTAILLTKCPTAALDFTIPSRSLKRLLIRDLNRGLKIAILSI